MRRPGRGFGGGHGHAITPPISRFDQLVSSVTVLQSVQQDLGITLATGVATWADQSGNGKDFTQPTAGLQPAYGAVTLNGLSVLSFTAASNHQLVSSLVTPLPGTTPTYVCFVARQNAWVGNGGILGDTQTGAIYPRIVHQTGGSPAIAAYSGVSRNNGNMTLGSWFFVQVYWSNSVADQIDVSTFNTSGISMGNVGVSTGRTIGKYAGTGGVSTSFDMAMCMHCSGFPSGPELTAIRALITSKYGAGVAV